MFTLPLGGGYRSTDRAVSPVVGVILVIAIAVILSGVVAAFVLNVDPGDEPVTGAAELSIEDDTLQIQVQESGNIAELIIRGSTEACDIGDTVIEDVQTEGEYERDLDTVDDCTGETLTLVGANADGGEIPLDDIEVPE